eukprot:14218414-Alexandrium_andersonii.AAC.1
MGAMLHHLRDVVLDGSNGSSKHSFYSMPESCFDGQSGCQLSGLQERLSTPLVQAGNRDAAHMDFGM